MQKILEQDETSEFTSTIIIHKKVLRGFIESALQKQIEMIEESVVKYVYEQMSYCEGGTKPDWVEGGNSIKQDEARRKAREILNQYK